MNLVGIEPWLQQLRINKIKPHFPNKGVHVDIGCDIPQTLINSVKNNMDRCIGLDPVVKNSKSGNVELKQMMITKKIDLPDHSADVITMLAVLEHMKYPDAVVSECYRILKPKGRLLITVPSPQGEFLLEHVLNHLGFVRKEMIDQHENYFTHDHLRQILTKAGFKTIKIENFEFGYNTFAKAIK